MYLLFQVHKRKPIKLDKNLKYRAFVEELCGSLTCVLKILCGLLTAEVCDEDNSELESD